MLFDSAAQKWTALADLSSGCPTWSQDSQFLYFQLFDVANPEFVRIRVSGGKREHIAPITFRRVQDIWYRWWNGLTPDDAPVVLRDESEEEIYRLDWELP
jgi:hypothetical protein